MGGEFDPDEHTGVGLGPAGGGGEVVGEGLEHEVTALAVGGADLVEVGGEVAGGEVVSDGTLGEGGGFEVGHFFGDGEFINEVGGGDHPAEAEGGGHNFGEGAEVEDPIIIEGADRRRGGFIVAEEAVGVIFDDRDLVLAGEVDELLAFRLAEADAKGVMGFGDDVDVGGAMAGGEEVSDGVDIHTGIEVGVDGEDFWLEGGGDLLGAGVDDIFHEDLATGVKEHTGKDVESLLGTGGDEDFIGGAGDAALGHEVNDMLFEDRGGGHVLEGFGVSGEGMAEGLAVVGRGEEFGVWEATSEGENAWLGDDGDHLAEDRPFHRVSPIGKLGFIVGDGQSLDIL